MAATAYACIIALEFSAKGIQSRGSRQDSGQKTGKGRNWRREKREPARDDRSMPGENILPKQKF